MSVDDYLIITEEQWKEKQKEIEAAEKMAAKVWEKYSQMVTNINLYTEQSETAARSAESQMKMLPSLVSGLDQYMQDSISVLQAAGKYIPLPADDWVKKAETVSIAIHKLVGEMSLLPDQINKLDLKKATLYFDNIRYGAESIEIFGNAHDILKDVDKALSGIYKTFKEGSSVAGSWKGVQDSIVQIRNGLTNIEKGAITTVAAFAEFTVVHDSIMNLVTGSDSVAEGLGKIVVAAGIAGTAMYTALGPAGLAVAAVTGLIAVLKGVSDAQEEAFNATPLGQFSQKMDELRENISAKSAEIRESLSEMTDGIKDAGVVEANMARDLAEAYEELAGKTSLTAEEQAKMRDISERLVDLVPGLNDYIDEQTGCLRIQGETLDALIDKMALYAQQQAIQGLMTDAYTKQYEADKIKREAEEAYQEAVNEYLADLNVSETIRTMILGGDIQRVREWQKKQATIFGQQGLVKDFGTEDGVEISRVLDYLQSAADQYNQACQEADEANREVAESIDYLKLQYGDVTSQIYDSSESIDKNKKQTAEYKQTLSDLKAEFRNMDLNISDQLAESLALLDEGTLESVTQMFETLKEQTALSTEELQQLFSAIAPGISEQFTESLAEQSPEMQLQVSTTLADLAAGAEVPIESLQEIFRMLGVDLPDEVISAFQEQEPYMQISAMNLLTKLGEGQQLVAENLQEVFTAMGIQLPAGLITALSESEAGVQQEAVSLLSQLKYASDEEREGLIGKLNALGIDSASLGFITGIASEEDNANTEGKNLVNASDEGVKTAVGQSSNYDYGADFGQGYAKGIMDQARSVANAAAYLVAAGAAAIQNAQKSHSPSKVTRGLGIDFSEGYEIGITDNEEDVRETVEDWMIRLRNQVIAFAQMPVDVEIARPEFPSVNYAAAVDSISDSMVMVPIKAELELGLEPYMKEASRQNALLEEQNKLLKDIREKPVIQDSDVFSSYRRSQQNYFARTGRVGISGID